jgi:uncharacterized protein (TIGR00251 family)
MLSEDGRGVLVAVRVKARASSARIEGERAGRLLVAVTAPPLDGRANDAVRRLIAKALGVAPSRVTIAGGARSRDKVLRIEGIRLDEVAKLLR